MLLSWSGITSRTLVQYEVLVLTAVAISCYMPAVVCRIFMSIGVLSAVRGSMSHTQHFEQPYLNHFRFDCDKICFIL